MLREWTQFWRRLLRVRTAVPSTVRSSPLTLPPVYPPPCPPTAGAVQSQVPMSYLLCPEAPRSRPEPPGALASRPRPYFPGPDLLRPLPKSPCVSIVPDTSSWHLAKWLPVFVLRHARCGLRVRRGDPASCPGCLAHHAKHRVSKDFFFFFNLRTKWTIYLSLKPWVWAPN